MYQLLFVVNHILNYFLQDEFILHKVHIKTVINLTHSVSISIVNRIFEKRIKHAKSKLNRKLNLFDNRSSVSRAEVEPNDRPFG